MKNYKGVLLGSVAASVLAAGALATPANAAGHGAKMADGSAVIGHKKGKFYVKSKDGNYSMLPGFNIQVDYSANNTDDDFGERSDVRRFTVRRGRASIKGRAGSPNLTYGISWDITTNTGTTNGIFDTNVNYKFIPELQVRAGQFKPLGNIVDNSGSSSGWLVDDANGTNGGSSISPSRSVGVQVHGKVAKVLTYQLGINNGQGFRGATANSASGWTAAMQYQPLGRYGNWAQPDYTAKSNVRMIVHTTYHANNNATGGNGLFGTYAGNALASSSYYQVATGVKFAGLALSAQYQHANYQADNKEFDGQRAYNWLLGASYMIVPKKVYVAATYSVTDDDVAQGLLANGGSIGAANGIDRQWGIGAAYLFRGHAHKLHASFDRLTTKVNSDLADGTGTTDNTRSDNTFKVRWQVQF